MRGASYSLFSSNFDQIAWRFFELRYFVYTICRPYFYEAQNKQLKKVNKIEKKVAILCPNYGWSTYRS